MPPLCQKTSWMNRDITLEEFGFDITVSTGKVMIRDGNAGDGNECIANTIELAIIARLAPVIPCWRVA
jgi:hypothetical protein